MEEGLSKIARQELTVNRITDWNSSCSFPCFFKLRKRRIVDEPRRLSRFFLSGNRIATENLGRLNNIIMPWCWLLWRVAGQIKGRSKARGRGKETDRWYYEQNFELRRAIMVNSELLWNVVNVRCIILFLGSLTVNWTQLTVTRDWNDDIPKTRRK
jgi:hypothetical protein